MKGTLLIERNAFYLYLCCLERDFPGTTFRALTTLALFRVYDVLFRCVYKERTELGERDNFFVSISPSF